MNKTTERIVNIILLLGMTLGGLMMWREQAYIWTAIYSILFASCATFLLFHFSSATTDSKDEKHA